MNSNKKGVSIIALAMVIAAMGFLVTIVGINVGNLIENTRAKEYASELEQLEYLVNDYKIRNNGKLDFTEYTLDTTNISSSFLAQLNEETITNNKIQLYEIDFTKIDAMGTKYGQELLGEQDIYLASEETGKVYYLMGYEYDDIVHYTLTDELKSLVIE